MAARNHASVLDTGAECDYDLHEACMFPQTSPSSHEFFPASTFKFFRIPMPSCHPHCKNNCDTCRRPINGFVYHCEKDDLDLHPCCQKLEEQYLIDDVEFKLHRKVRDKCKLCNKKRLTNGRSDEHGWSYISECKKYHFHVACMPKCLWKNGTREETTTTAPTTMKTTPATTTTAPTNNNSSTGNNNNNTRNGNDESLSLSLGNVNLNAIEARGRGHGGGGKKYLKILKIFFKDYSQYPPRRSQLHSCLSAR